MPGSIEDKLYLYYQQELQYLRQAGQLFAKKHPKLAKRLDFHQGESADPHTERLLESFAFLTGRLQWEIDEKFPKVTSALLSILYPHLVHPIPSMSIAQFQVDPTKGKLTDGYTLPRGMQLQSMGEGGVGCRFRTCFDVTLWPIVLDKIEFFKADDCDFPKDRLLCDHLIKFDFKSLSGPFSSFSMSELQFYLSGDPLIIKRMFDLLGHEVPAVFLVSNNGHKIIELRADSFQFSGLEESESVLPLSPRGHPAYRLLQEYFSFPNKFNFMKIRGIDLSLIDSDEMSLCIGLSSPVLAFEMDSISKDNFLLGCTPIINLFDRVSEPLRLNHFSSEYRLIPDLRRERTTEIYDIRKVSSSVDGQTETKAYAPYFSLSHKDHIQKQDAFWYARRKPTIHPQMSGSDIYLSFVNVNSDPIRMQDETVFAHLTCTNRGLAEQIPPGAILQVEASTPTAKIVCLERPTPQIEPIQDGETQWKLIACLSLNHLSLESTHDAAQSLKEMVTLLASKDQAWAVQEINGIRNLHYNKVFRRLRPEAWRGFAQGIEIQVEVDERHFVYRNPLILMSILNEFFDLYVASNSFTELVIKSTNREGDWRRWPMKMGASVTL
jgi:type VI secretion system protein ImpG